MGQILRYKARQLVSNDLTTDTKGWDAGAVMVDASLNRRQTIRVGAGVAFA
jgi:hypothetical protein